MPIDFERRCWAEIDLDRIRGNYALIKNMVGDAGVMAVVKANAYGHGDVVVAKALEAAGCDSFAVASYTEALRLRGAGVRRPVLILGYTRPDYAPRLVQHNLVQTVFSSKYAKMLSDEAKAADVAVTVDFKADTGLGRIGFPAKQDMATAAAEIMRAASLPGLKPRGLFTHFASPGSPDESDFIYTEQQFMFFEELHLRLSLNGLKLSPAHASSSAAFLAHHNMILDLVRPGILLYGYEPEKGLAPKGLAPSMKLKAVVSQVKDLRQGEAVSYGRTFIAERNMRVAAIAAGYDDGYPRGLSGKGVVELYGKPAPVLGRVCMDQIVVDVTKIPKVKAGDTATLFGGEAGDSVDDAADKSGTLNYALLCAPGMRVPRVYLENGVETQITEYMEVTHA